MRRLLVLLTVVICVGCFSMGCGSGSPGGSTGGHIKLTEEQMKQAKEAQMKAMMQQKAPAPAAK